MYRLAEILVLKVGGSLKQDSLEAVVQAVESALGSGKSICVVHGGGPRITAALEKHQIQLPFVDGQRMTTPAAMEIVEQVLKDINREIVQQLLDAGLPAVAVPVEMGVLQASPVPGLERTARVGDVDTSVLKQWTGDGRVPVIAPVAKGSTGDSYNVNADIAAGAIAGAWQAKRAVFLTDVAGIYKDFERGELLTYAAVDDLKKLLASGSFTAGMIPKVGAVLEAIARGVHHAFVVDGRNRKAVTWAVSSDLNDSGGELPLGTRISLHGRDKDEFADDAV